MEGLKPHANLKELTIVYYGEEVRNMDYNDDQLGKNHIDELRQM